MKHSSALERQRELEDLLNGEKEAHRLSFAKRASGSLRDIPPLGIPRRSLDKLNIVNLPNTASVESSVRSTPRLTGALTSPRLLPVKDVLPGSMHHFVLKVRKTTEDLADAMNSLSRAQATVVASQL